MGIKFKDVVVKKEITFEELAGKRIAFDTYNILYQFLAAIRQRDGSPLRDSEGNITSHLIGLFSRTARVMEHGIKPCFVFDGKPPELKAETSKARRKIKLVAEEKYKLALQEDKLEDARKYAQQTSVLTPEMVRESKELIRAMGLPWVQAIADGEAQAAWMANKGHVWAVASQDYDALLFGTPRLIRNLTISGRKKLQGKHVYESVKPESINLADTLNELKIDIKGLVQAAILVGTDFNNGIKGIGPKTAIKEIKSGQYEKHAKTISRHRQVEKLFLEPAISTSFDLNWTAPDADKIRELLIKRHDFGGMRVNSAIKRIEKAYLGSKQLKLSGF